MNTGTGAALRFVACILIAGRAAAAPAPPAAAGVRPENILAHLEQTISWYRNVIAVEQSAALANDVLLRDTARRMSTEALQLAFDFARAQAAFLSAGQPQPPAEAPSDNSRPGSPARMEQVAARAAERVAAVQARLKGIDAALEKASGRSRLALLARRKQVIAELDLAKQVQDSVRNLVAFMGAAGSSNGGLLSRIDRLERSVPEAIRTKRPAPQTAPAAAAPATETLQVFHPETAGVFGLAAELFTLTRTRTRLGHVIDETDALLESIAQLRTPLSNEVRNAVRRSDAIEASSSSGDPAQLAIAHSELAALASRFKQVTAALTPLREQGILVETSRGNLVESRAALDGRYATVAGYLFLRAAVLGIAVCVLLVISELWRRMTFRYARDARRRRQFLLLRRVVVGGAIVLVVLLGVVSEVGSLATYAGFLTAGLAVALQNPIMSVVAYVFLIGRYGLRVGDRVTISGVTGDVIEIGLVRLHLMEVAGKGGDLYPTGRVVAFSNSVLFQPAALFKQMPGADYVWHTATLTLAPECDPRLAESTLMAAVDSVYQDYREEIERQHAQFERTLDIKLAPPQPQGRVRYTDAGLEFSVHYPANIRRGCDADERIMRALQETIAQDPNLALARSGEPKLQEAV